MDEHVITDWKAYFDALGPGRPCAYPDKTPPYAGPANPHVVYVLGEGAATVTSYCSAESLFEYAKASYEANECPEMWVFSHTGGPPWHVKGKPVKPTKGKR